MLENRRILPLYGLGLFFSIGVVFINQVYDLGIQTQWQQTWLYWILILPLLEEVVFRGWLQEALDSRLVFRIHFKIKSAVLTLSLANITTSLVFSLLHLIWLPYNQALLIFVPSLFFGLLKDHYQSLIPPIAFHVLFNALFIIFNLDVILT